MPRLTHITQQVLHSLNISSSMQNLKLFCSLSQVAITGLYEAEHNQTHDFDCPIKVNKEQMIHPSLIFPLAV